MRGRGNGVKFMKPPPCGNEVHAALVEWLAGGAAN